MERWYTGEFFTANYESKGYHLGPRTNVEYSLSKHVSINWGVGLLYGRDNLTQTQSRLDDSMDLDGNRKRVFLDSNLSLRVYSEVCQPRHRRGQRKARPRNVYSFHGVNSGGRIPVSTSPWPVAWPWA